MAEVSFGVQGAADATPVGAAPAPTVPPSAPAAASVPAVRQTRKIGDRIPSLDEIMVPFVNVVHPLSQQLVQSFPVGSLVYDKSTLLYTPADIDKNTGNVKRAATAPVVITVLGFGQTRFSEKVEGGQGGMLVYSEEQVTAAGGTLNWNEWNAKKASGMKRFDVLEEMLVLIQRPEQLADDGTVFTFPIDGKKYAMAKFAVKSTAYNEVCKKQLFYWRQAGCMNDAASAGVGYPSRQVFLTTFLKPFRTGNSSWVPTLKAGPENTPEFLKFAQNVLGGF